MQNNSCWVVPLWRGGEECTEGQQALFWRQLCLLSSRSIFYLTVLPWVFFARAEGDAANGHLNLLAFFSAGA